jgi:transposase
VIRFCELKGLKTRAIRTDFESVYGPEALALATVKKWQRRFHHERVNLLDDPRFGRFLTKDLVGQWTLCLKKGRSVRVRCFVTTSGLERRRACENFTTGLA